MLARYRPEPVATVPDAVTVSSGRTLIAVVVGGDGKVALMPAGYPVTEIVKLAHCPEGDRY